MVLLQDTEIEDVMLSSSGESDDEDNEPSAEKALKHKNLLDDLDADLGHVKRKEFSTSRTEPSEEISEYTWSSTKEKISLQDLVGSVDSKSVAKVKKKLSKMKNKTKVMEKPLEKPQQQRVERSVAYEETSKDVTKWNTTIQKNREADQLTFPLRDYKPPPVSTKNMVMEYKPQNDMEKQISEVLYGSKHLLERKGKELTEAEEKALQVVDLEEALERRKELQRARALQSYYEVKCHRAKKIKSKKYHRMLKKDAKKSLSKVDLEVLAKEDPELYQSEMEKAEQLRAKERASLRHRNTSKWAKNLITKGKSKTKEDQERIREQLAISRKLTDHAQIEDSDDDGDDNNGDTENNKGDKVNEGDTIEISLMEKVDEEDNPWLLGNEKKNENETLSGEMTGSVEAEYVKLEPIKNKDDSPDTPKDQIVDAEDVWTEAGKVTEDENKKKSKKTRKKKRSTKVKDIDESSESKNIPTPADTMNKICKNSKQNEIECEIENAVTEESDENNKQTDSHESGGILNEKVLDICDGDMSDSDDDLMFDNTEQMMNISEAFANDDVVGDFIQEKNDIIERSKPKAVDLSLPGWGDWGGPGLNISKRKRKRFTKPAGPAPKRKDEGYNNVIINEKQNEGIAKHQVSAVPFPYTNKIEFERSLRQPIGGHWNTPSVHSTLIEPRIRIKPGVNIEPMKASRKMKKKFRKEAAVK